MTRTKQTTQKLTKKPTHPPVVQFQKMPPATAGKTALQERLQYIDTTEGRAAQRLFARSMRVGQRNIRRGIINPVIVSPLDTGLSELARNVFGGEIIQKFKDANHRFNVRSLFELTTPQIQCNNTIGKVNYHNTLCWICGLVIQPIYGLNEECEHVLPIAQATYFLALYGPEFQEFRRKFIAEYKKRVTNNTPDDETWIQKKNKYSFFDTIFTMEYDYAHSACNQVKNDMCGIYCKLATIDGSIKAYATINKESIINLLTDIYIKKSHQLLYNLRPLLKKEYPTLDNFIVKRTPAFINKYLDICKFLNQCNVFSEDEPKSSEECLYKFNLLCIAGAGAIKNAIGYRNKELLNKYSKDLETFKSSQSYLKFLSIIYSAFINEFTLIYNNLLLIFENGDELRNILRIEQFKNKKYILDLADTYFNTVSSVCSYAYITYLYDKNISDLVYNIFINNLPKYLIGLILNFRFNIMELFADFIKYKQSVLPATKSIIEGKIEIIRKLVYSYVKFDKVKANAAATTIPPTQHINYINFRTNLSLTHIYSEVSEKLQLRFKLYDDLIIVLKFTLPPSTIDKINFKLNNEITKQIYLLEDEQKPQLPIGNNDSTVEINTIIEEESSKPSGESMEDKEYRLAPDPEIIKTKEINPILTEHLIELGPAAFTIQIEGNEIGAIPPSAELIANQQTINNIITTATPEITETVPIQPALTQLDEANAVLISEGGILIPVTGGYRMRAHKHHIKTRKHRKVRK